MAIDNLPNGSDQSHLSGAYIRSLVKKLSTTSSKPCLNTTQNLNINNNDTLSIIVPPYNTTTNNNNNNNNTMNPTTTKKLATPKPTHHQLDPTQVGHKKQVRRRLHTGRPYQERLLNMAETRKEIITALKFHRATMKQANEKKHHHNQHQHHQQYNNNNNNNNNDFSSQHKVKSEPLLEDNSSTYYYSSYNRNHNNQNYYYPLPSNNIISTQSSLVGPTPFYERLNNIALPNQTLGLNLNLQAFSNLDVKFFHNNKNSTTTTTVATATTLSSTDASPSLPLSPEVEAEGVGPTNNNMHNPSLDEEEITKMRAIGEQFLKMVDFGKDIKGCYYNNKNNNKKKNYYNNENDHDILSEEELMEFPPWLGASSEESFLHHQPLDDSCSEDNTTLPGMDIEDIDGMDDEWLS